MEHTTQTTTTYTLNWVVGPDGTQYVVLTNSSLPIVQMQVVNLQLDLCDCIHRNVLLKHIDDSHESHSLPESSRLRISCHLDHVPVRCDSEIIGHDHESKHILFRLSSVLFRNLIEVRVEYDPQLDSISKGVVFFPMRIGKNMVRVEKKMYELNPCMKGKLAREKESVRQKIQLRQQHDVAQNCEEARIPLQVHHMVQRPNQVWNIHSNEWVRVKKPNPKLASMNPYRVSNWVWDDSTLRWTCKLDPSNHETGLEGIDRSNFSNCFPPSKN